MRLVHKWLQAGVLEDGTLTVGEDGVPQGATISPLLANLYAHYVLDLWVKQWRGRHARGDVMIVRYADDFVMGFQYRDEAERFLRDLRERLAKFGLELHPEKTRMLEFGRFAAMNRREREVGKPESFNFLGFTHSCAVNRKGTFFVKRSTMRTRMRAKLKEIGIELKRRRHHPIPNQGRWLGSVVRGHIRYFAVPYNGDVVCQFRAECIALWRRALRQRSHRTRVTWPRIKRLASRWLHQPESVTPGPTRASTPRPEAGAQCGSSARWDLCGGGPTPRALRSVPTATAHALRGMYASLGTKAGLSAEAMAASLGHSSPVIMEQHYTRPESKAAARQQAVLRVVQSGQR